MSDGIRTHDRLDHNQELYQLSYAHHGSRARPGLGMIAEASSAASQRLNRTLRLRPGDSRYPLPRPGRAAGSAPPPATEGAGRRTPRVWRKWQTR